MDSVSITAIIVSGAATVTVTLVSAVIAARSAHRLARLAQDNDKALATLAQDNDKALRAVDWSHGGISRRREAYVAGLTEGLAAIERGRGERRIEFATATACIKLYGSQEAVGHWDAFVDALSPAPQDSARAAFKEFTAAARVDDQAAL